MHQSENAQLRVSDAVLILRSCIVYDGFCPQGCGPTGLLVRVPTQKFGGGGYFVELVRRQESEGPKPTCSVLVHQRRLIEEELDPYGKTVSFRSSLMASRRLMERRLRSKSRVCLTHDHRRGFVQKSQRVF